MRSLGYDVERGEKGTTTENLSVLEYKTQQEANRLQDLVLQAMVQKEVLEEYERKIKTKKEYIEVSKQVKDMGKPSLIGTDIRRKTGFEGYVSMISDTLMSSYN